MKEVQLWGIDHKLDAKRLRAEQAEAAPPDATYANKAVVWVDKYNNGEFLAEATVRAVNPDGTYKVEYHDHGWCPRNLDPTDGS